MFPNLFMYTNNFYAEWSFPIDKIRYFLLMYYNMRQRYHLTQIWLCDTSWDKGIIWPRFDCDTSWDKCIIWPRYIMRQRYHLTQIWLWYIMRQRYHTTQIWLWYNMRQRYLLTQIWLWYMNSMWMMTTLISIRVSFVWYFTEKYNYLFYFTQFYHNKTNQM